MDMPRDFIGYGGNPPRFEWPNGARLALNIVVNYEEGAERNPLDGDPQREDTSEAVFPAKPGEREKHQESVYEYGSRVGIYRIIDLFDRYQVRPTIFACALALERNPPVTQEFIERKYDIVRAIAGSPTSDSMKRKSGRKSARSIAFLRRCP